VNATEFCPISRIALQQPAERMDGNDHGHVADQDLTVAGLRQISLSDTHLIDPELAAEPPE
jgi:hypothetical protein